MAIDWTPLVEMVRDRKHFLISTHVRPDPDALGSQLGLAAILEPLGKRVDLVIASAWPPRYTFMDPERRIARFDPANPRYAQADAIVILDTGTWSQLGDFGDFMKTSNAAKLVIDHHLSSEDLGAIRLADTSAEATGRLICEAAQALGQPITPKAANALFAALATDTGWFRHANTSAATFALAEMLTQAGAEPMRLYDQLYEQNSAARVNLLGVILQRLHVVENGKVALAEVRRGDYDATGASPSDTEDAIGWTRSVVGVEVGLFFAEQPAGGVKVSFRSRGHVDVAKFAEQFGGGGHRLASGVILQASLEEAKSRVLEALKKVLP